MFPTPSGRQKMINLLYGTSNCERLLSGLVTRFAGSRPPDWWATGMGPGCV